MSARGPLLLALARAAIHRGLGGPEPTRPEAPWLDEPGACFVSLKQDGQLRGCIGNVRAVPRLHDAVVHNAESAAFRDPRFPPLRREELARTRIEVSLLSPFEAIAADTREALLGGLRPGVDGLMLTAAPHSAVFIPSVWEQLPEKEAFLEHLLAKGRFPRGRWPAGMRAERFTAELFEEAEETA